jgi:hypothetical protein
MFCAAWRCMIRQVFLDKARAREATTRVLAVTHSSAYCFLQLCSHALVTPGADFSAGASPCRGMPRT